MRYLRAGFPDFRIPARADVCVHSRNCELKLSPNLFHQIEMLAFEITAPQPNFPGTVPS